MNNLNPRPVKPLVGTTTDRCWTCNEPMTDGGQHNCVVALKLKVHKLVTAYTELKEQAINAGLTVRHVNL